MTDKLYHECHEAVCQTRTLLEELSAWGFASLPEPASGFSPADEKRPAGMAAQAGAHSLEELGVMLKDCTRCGLSRTRSKVVIGRGNPRARLVFVGEAPGQQEDQQGQPFVGEAGRLLDRIIQAMGLTSDEVYICNVIKCRPPGNRDPEPEEIATCEPFLQQQLALIRPQVIVALGRFSAQTLLATSRPISKLRGSWHQYAGICLMPTFHPAYLLRSPAEKKRVWQDMKQVMQRLSAEKEG